MIAEELKLIITAETDRAIQQLKGFREETDKTKSAGMSLGEAFTSFSTGINQSLEILGKIGRTMKEVMDAAEAAATINQLNAAFRNLADDAGLSADELLDSMREASRGTIKTTDLMKAASRANLFGLPMERLGDLMKIARASAQATGQDMTFMFDSIVTGIGRASPLILDNLGIIVRLEEVYEKFAASAGKKADELTDAERSQALFNQVLASGEDIIRKVGNVSSTDVEKFAQFKVAVSEARTEIAKDAIPAMSTLAGAGATLAEQFTEAKQRGDAVDETLKNISKSAKESGEKIGILTKALLFFGGMMMKKAPLKSGPEGKSILESQRSKGGPISMGNGGLKSLGPIAGGAADYARYFEAVVPVMEDYNNELGISMRDLPLLQKMAKEHAEAIDAQRDSYARAYEAVAPYAEALGTMMMNASAGADAMKEAVKGAIVSVLQMLAKKAFIESLIAFGELNFGVGSALMAASLMASTAAGAVQAMAEGGIVTGPTNALIGESGPEAVIPLDRMGGMGTHVHYHVAGNMMAEEQFYQRSHAYSQGAQRGY